MSEIIGDEIRPPRLTKSIRQATNGRPVEPFSKTYEMAQINLSDRSERHETSNIAAIEAQNYWNQIKGCMRSYDVSSNEASWMLNNWDSIDYLSAEFDLEVPQAIGFIKAIGSLVGEVDLGILKEIRANSHERLGYEGLGTVVQDFLDEAWPTTGMTTSDGVPILCSIDMTEKERKNRALLMEGTYVEGQREEEESLFDYGMNKLDGASPDQLDNLVQRSE